MSLGSLKNQVTYPDTLEVVQQKGVTIAQLDEIMRIVHLKYLVEREGGKLANKLIYTGLIDILRYHARMGHY